MYIGGVQRYQMMMSDSALWTGFPFRDDDVVISPPAKCGTSWMQMLCALLVFDRLISALKCRATSTTLPR